MEMKAFSLVDEKTGAKARVSQFGATIISWITEGKEHLFLSEKAVLDGTKAIRGGIPLVFPCFGKATTGPCTKLPQHGFARNHLWQLKSKDVDTATLSLSLDDLSEDAKAAWPFDFELNYIITVRGSALTTRLEIHNPGKASFDFQTLLHTYFRVDDISNTHVEGLHDITYKDKVSSSEIKEESMQVKCTAETDRVYPHVKDSVHIYQDGKLYLGLERQGLDDIVVWNPWDGCAKMGDFGPADGYKNMICVEAGSVSGWNSLTAGDKYVAQQVITARL